MSEAWVSFARTGDPGHAGLPSWPAVTSSERATMIFDNECQVINDPFGDQRRAMQAMRERNQQA